MGLFIAKTDTLVQTDYLYSDAEERIIEIAMGDTGIGFDYSFPVNIEGMVCIPVTYFQTESGPTTDRLNVLVNNSGLDHGAFVNYTSPPHIIILAVDDTYSTPSGPVPDFGLTFKPGQGNPFMNHVAVYYNVSPCSGKGVWVHKEGGGTVDANGPALLLYHELAHAYQYIRGGPSNDETQAITDENEMRDELGQDLRDVNNPGGGCNTSLPPPKKWGKNCIIASLATGSQHSSEVNRLRHLREHILRRSEVGDDFFKHFHYHYYTFSPEICRLMWQQPDLSPLIRKYFVVPLITGFELLVHYSERHGQGLVDLLREQAKREDLIEIYQSEFMNELAACLSFAENYDQTAIVTNLLSKGEDFAGVADVLRYVNEQTVKGDFIKWALVDVLGIWLSSASLLATEKTDQEINAAIHALISEWISQLPITRVWGELSRLETENELNSLEQFIFDRESKEIFAERLIKKYPQYSAAIRVWAQS